MAGDKAAEALAPELLAAGIDCYRVLFPRGMDANEYAEKVKPAEKSLGLVLRQAVWMGKGKKALEEELTVERAAVTAAPKPAPVVEAVAEENAAPAPSSPLAAEAVASTVSAAASAEPPPAPSKGQSGTASAPSLRASTSRTGEARS